MMYAYMRLFMHLFIYCIYVYNSCTYVYREREMYTYINIYMCVWINCTLYIILSKCWKDPRPLLSLHTLLPRFFSNLGSSLWLVAGPYHGATGFHPHQTIAGLFIRAVAGTDQTCQRTSKKKRNRPQKCPTEDETCWNLMNLIKIHEKLNGNWWQIVKVASF